MKRGRWIKFWLHPWQIWWFPEGKELENEDTEWIRIKGGKAQYVGGQQVGPWTAPLSRGSHGIGDPSMCSALILMTILHIPPQLSIPLGDPPSSFSQRPVKPCLGSTDQSRYLFPRELKNKWKQNFSNGKRISSRRTHEEKEGQKRMISIAYTYKLPQ